MTAFHLRAARSLDAGRVGAILSDFMEETPWMPRIHSRAEDIGFAGMMIDRGWVTIAEESGEILGFLACHNATIHALYVDGPRRSSGCGSALLARAKREAEALTLWTFQANTRAQAFYENHGFRVLQRTDGADNDEKLPDVQFGWRRSEQTT